MSAVRWRPLPQVMVLLVVFFPVLGTAQEWTPVAAVGRSTVSDLLVHDGVLYAAAWERVYRSADSGMNWDPPRAFPTLGVSPDMTGLAAAGGTVLAGTMIDGVYRSIDAGATWTRFNDGLSGTALRVSAVAVRGDSVYAGTDGAGVYVRDLAGVHPWSPYNQGLGWFTVNAMTTFDDMLCAQISEFFFFRRAGAAEWESVPWNDFGTQVAAKRLFAHGGKLLAGVPRGLLRWDARAPMWEALDVDPGSNRHGAAFASHGDTLLAAMQVTIGWHQLVRSVDGGTRWTLHEESQGEVHALLAHAGILWSARTDGLWMHPLGIPTVTEPVPETPRLALDPPFPQPAADAVSIVMHTREATSATLRLHDALGRELRTLFSGADIPPGSHRVVADLTGLPPGWYTVVLRTPDGVAHRLLSHQ